MANCRFFVLVLMVLYSGCLFRWGTEIRPLVIEESPFKECCSKNMQQAKIFIQQRSLDEAQKLAIQNAKNELLNRVLKKIDAIFGRCGIYDHYINGLIKKDVQRSFDKQTILLNTIVKPEGYLYILISTDFSSISEILKNNIPAYLRTDFNKWMEFKENVGLKFLHEQISDEFTIRG